MSVLHYVANEAGSVTWATKVKNLLSRAGTALVMHGKTKEWGMTNASYFCLNQD